MEIEGIYTGEKAEDPEKVNDEYLPKGVSSEAAYVLKEAVEGGEISEINDELGVSAHTVKETLEDLRSRNLISFDFMKRREKDYTATQKGSKIIEIYKNAIHSVKDPDNFENDFGSVKREMVFGRGQLNAYEEFKFILDYIFYDKSIAEIAEENECRNGELLNMRDSLEPEIIEETSDADSKIVDYEITNTGLQALITLSESNYFERINEFLNKNDHEIVMGEDLDFEEENESSNGVDWSRL